MKTFFELFEFEYTGQMPSQKGHSFFRYPSRAFFEIENVKGSEIFFYTLNQRVKKLLLIFSDP